MNLQPHHRRVLQVFDQHGYPVHPAAVPRMMDRFVGDETTWGEVLDELAVLGLVEMVYNEDSPGREQRGWVLTRKGRRQMRRDHG